MKSNQCHSILDAHSDCVEEIDVRSLTSSDIEMIACVFKSSKPHETDFASFMSRTSSMSLLSIHYKHSQANKIITNSLFIKIVIC